MVYRRKIREIQHLTNSNSRENKVERIIKEIFRVYSRIKKKLGDTVLGPRRRTTKNTRQQRWSLRLPWLGTSPAHRGCSCLAFECSVTKSTQQVPNKGWWKNKHKNEVCVDILAEISCALWNI